MDVKACFPYHLLKTMDPPLYSFQLRLVYVFPAVLCKNCFSHKGMYFSAGCNIII